MSKKAVAPLARQLKYDLRVNEPYEAAADLIALTAYPWSTEADLQQLTQRRLVARHLRERLSQDPSIWSKTIRVKPGYLLMEEKRSRDGASHLEKRLRRRMDAAHTLLPFVVAVLRGEDPQRGISPELLTQARQKTRAGMGKRDARNFRKRAIADSEPVFHMALAWALLAFDQRELGGQGPTHLDLMGDEALLRRWVAAARQMEALLRIWSSSVGDLRLTKVLLTD